jgi:hypothetical protein
MTARIAVRCSSLSLALVAVACVRGYTVPIDTPMHAKLDVSSFQRVLVAGFVVAGSTEIDTNVETVRLLRSRLRSKTPLTVVEADVLALTQIAVNGHSDMNATAVVTNGSQNAERPRYLKREKDLDAYHRVFADVAFWKRLGEEYQDPLIVTGTLFFTARPGGGSLKATFLFIDGRTGTVLYSESFPANVSLGNTRHVPALTSYFLVMDRVLPDFLGALSDQKVRGNRLLLR